MTGPIVLTPNLKLSKLPENYHVWAVLMNTNLAIIDAGIGSFVSLPGMRGAWGNSTSYALGDITIDLATNTLWLCKVAHTSATLPTTFAQDRTAHPTFWQTYLPPAHARGVWTGPGTNYIPNDFVLHGTRYAMCLVSHVSSGDFDFDVLQGYWVVLIDVGNQTLPLLSGNPTDANKMMVTNSLGTTYITVPQAVDTTAALIAMTDRPASIITKGAMASGDGGGGLWVYKQGDATPVDGATIVSPSGSPTGRYFRVYNGPKQIVWWCGAHGAGVDSSAGINAALATGGTFQFSPGTWATLSQITVGVVGTSIDLNGATLQDITGFTQNSFMMVMSATDCTLRNGKLLMNNSSASGLGSISGALTVQASRCGLYDLDVEGKVYNPQFPNRWNNVTNTVGYNGPIYGILISPANSAGPNFSLIEEMYCDSVYVKYCVNGIRHFGTRNSTYINCRCEMQLETGFGSGAGAPVLNSSFINIRVRGSGLYGYQFSNAVPGNITLWPVPYRNVWIDGLVTEDCGFGSAMTATQGLIGSGKGGFATSTSNMCEIYIRATARNCAKGGGEFKYTIQPASTTVYPVGFKNLVADVDTVMSIDNGVGFFISCGSPLDLSTDCGLSTIHCNTTLAPPELMTLGLWYEPMQTRVLNGWVWLCLGNSTGMGGVCGGTPPPVGGSPSGPANQPSYNVTYVVNMVGTGNTGAGGVAVIAYTSATMALPGAAQAGVADAPFIVGQTLFAGVGNGFIQALPDGTTITAIDTAAKTITCSAPLAAGFSFSGSTPIMSSRRFNDGLLNWLAWDSDRSAAPVASIGVQVGPSQRVTVDGGTIRGVWTGLQLNIAPGSSSDNAIADCTVKNVDMETVVQGIRGPGTGTMTRLLIENVSIRANVAGMTSGFSGLNIADGGSTWDLAVKGCRFVVNGGTATAPAIILNNGTVTMSLDNCYLEGRGRSMQFGSSTTAVHTQTVSCRGACTFATVAGGATTTPVLVGVGSLAGSTSSLTWGNGSMINHGGGSTVTLGWTTQISGVGTVSVKGMVQRVDATMTAGAPSNTLTFGNVGEWFPLDVPTATEYGYFCQAIASNAGPFTWKKLALV